MLSRQLTSLQPICFCWAQWSFVFNIKFFMNYHNLFLDVGDEIPNIIEKGPFLEEAFCGTVLFAVSVSSIQSRSALFMSEQTNVWGCSAWVSFEWCEVRQCGQLYQEWCSTPPFTLLPRTWKFAAYNAAIKLLLESITFCLFVEFSYAESDSSSKDIVECKTGGFWHE